MLKNILAVVVGYIAMALFLFISFSIAYLLMGADGAFQPGSYEVSTLWLIISIVVGLIGAVIGGLVCIAIGKSFRTALVLAGVVLVLGIVFAIPTLTDSRDSASMVRSGDVGNLEAMQDAHQPPWLAFLNPLIGVAGVVAGTRLRRQSKPTN